LHLKADAQENKGGYLDLRNCQFLHGFYSVALYFRTYFSERVL